MTDAQLRDALEEAYNTGYRSGLTNGQRLAESVANAEANHAIMRDVMVGNWMRGLCDSRAATGETREEETDGN